MKRNVKKFMAFLMVAIIIAVSVSPVSPVQAASKPQFTVKVSTANPRPGETFTAELWLERNSGLSYFALLFSYDLDAFEYVKHEKGETLKELDVAMVDYDENEPGDIAVFADYGEGKADMAGGQMCVLTLKVKENATGSGNISVLPNGIGLGTNGEEIILEPKDFAIKVKDATGNEIQGGDIPIQIPVQSLTLNKTEPFTMARGTSEKLTVTAKPANALDGKEIEWSSSAPEVVTVDKEGNIQAVGAGDAKVTVKAGGKTASVNITVNVPLTAIELNRNTLTLAKGEEQTLKVSYAPEDTTDSRTVTWRSSNEKAAVVEKGVVTAKGAGKAVITAKAANGLTAKCEVTVVEDSGNPDSTGSWVQDSNGWWYRNEDGSYPYNCWTLIDNKWYYFNSAGYRVTDWKSIRGKWYYFEPTTGVMQTGWLSFGNTSYYLTSSGAMAVGWHEVDGIWYYFESSGAMKRGWHWNGSKWYYLNSDGTMAVKWNSVKGIWYYFESSGAMKTGWLKDGSTWYYFEGSGAMKTGWLKQGSKWYYLRTSGDMATGWEKVGIDTYYFLPSGEMVTGWNLIDDIWYYFKGSGAMQTGWLKDRSIWYYLDADGKMVTGWKEVEGYIYYFGPSGAMYTGVHVIDGITYDFGSSGGIRK